MSLRRKLRRGFYVVMFFAICFYAAYFYAHLAGEWASLFVIDSPPNAILLHDFHYNQYGYNNYLRLYSAQGTLQTVRAWYNERIPMSPVNGVLSQQDTGYCSIQVHPENVVQYRFLFTAAFISLNSEFRGYDTAPSCFSVCVSKTVPNSEYPILGNTTFDIQQDNVVVALNTCWPDW